MNKLLQKVAKIFLGLSMAAGVGVTIGAGRKEADCVSADTTSGFISNASGQGTSGTGSSVTATSDGISFTFTKGYGTGTQIRSYGGTITLSYTSSVSAVTAINMTVGDGKTGGTWSGATVSSGSVTWSSLANNASISHTSQARITALSVTFTASGGTTVTKTITGPSNMSKSVGDTAVDIANDIKVDGSVFSGCTVASSDEAVVQVASTTLSFVGAGSSTITISHDNDVVGTTTTVYTSASFSVTVAKQALPSMPNGDFKKITTSNELTDGYYLLVVEGEYNKAFDGSLASLDQNSGTSVTISNNKIATSSALSSASLYIENISGSTYSIAANVSASGNAYKYIGRTNNSNGVDVTDSVQSNTISFDGGKAEILGTGGRKLNWYTNNSNFRYYASTNETLVYLYKKVSSYTVTKNATNCTIGGDSSLDGTANAIYTITPSTNYNAPTSITVTRGGSTLTLNTDYTYSVSNNVGTLTILAAAITDNLSITAAGIATYAVTGSITNGSLTIPGRIVAGGTLTVTISPSNGHGYPASDQDITVTNATISSYDSTSGAIVLANPTGDVTVTATCQPLGQEFSITTVVQNGTYTGDTTIANNGGTASVTISPTGDYKLPTSVSVTGADHTYNSTSGVISLSNATGDVSISASMVALTEYSITVNETNGTHTGATTIKESRTASLTFTPSSGYGQPSSVTVSGATSSWARGTGVLSLSNPTGNVTVTYAATANELDSISLSSNSGSYTLGQAFVRPTVTAHYTVIADADITNDENLSVTGYDPYTTGSQTVTFSYTYGGNTETATYTATVSAASVVTTVTWEKVTSTSDISVNDVIIIADSSHNVALSTEQRTNNRGAAAITKANDKITWSDQLDYEPQQLTLTSTSGITSAPSGSFGLYTGSGYLYAAGSTGSSGGNYLKTQNSNNINGAFVITVSEGVATISATGSSNRPLMRSNYSNSPSVFACYASGSTTGNALEIYKKVETQTGTAELIRITASFSPSVVKYVGDSISLTDFIVKKQLNTGNNLIDVESGYTISSATLSSTHNVITVSYTEENITKTAAVVIDVEERPASVSSVTLVQGEGVVKDYVDWSGASWNYTGLTVHCVWTDSSFDEDLTLADLIQSGDATVSPAKPSVGVTSFTVSYTYHGTAMTSNTVSGITVVTDYVTSISWTGTHAEQFKAFSGSQLTAAQVGSWSVVPTFAGAGTGSALSFGDYVLKVGTKTISSLPYTWQTEDDGQNLTITYGKDASGNDFVKSNGTAKANICASINAIDHDEETSTTTDVYGYKKVTSAPSMDTGDTLQVVIAANVDGTYHAMSGISSSKGQSYTPTVSSDIISVANATYVWTLTKTSTGYTLSDSNGKITTGTNTNISTTSSGTDFAITSGTKGTFRIAPSSGSNRPLIYRASTYNVFGGYAASNVTAAGTEYYDLELFTYQVVDTETHTSTETVHYANQMAHFDTQKAVVAFAKFMNDTMNGENVCSGTQANLSTAWSSVASKYAELITNNSNLSSDEKTWANNMLKYATASWASSEEAACVEKAMQTYEFCVTRHSDVCNAFLSGVRTVSAPHVSPLLNVVGKNTNTVAIIVIISMVSVTAIGGYFFLRKRKED